MESDSGHDLRCILSIGDIHGQILICLPINFLSLTTGLALIAAENPTAWIITIGLAFVLSLPFLMFTFVTAFINQNADCQQH